MIVLDCKLHKSNLVLHLEAELKRFIKTFSGMVFVMSMCKIV